MTTPYYAAHGGPVVVQGHVVGGVPVSTNQQQQHPYNNNISAATFAADTFPQGEAQPKRCNDALFGILFYAHLGVMAYVAAVYTPQMYSNIDSGGGGGGGRRHLLSRNLQEEEDQGYLALGVNDVLVILGISGAVGLVMSALALSFMMTFASAVIKVALIFNIVVSGLMALSALLTGVLPLAMLLFLSFAVSCCYARAVWSRIPFAASNLVTAITAVRANLGVSFFAYLSLVLTFGWTLWWSVAFVASTFVTNGCDADGVCDTEPSAVMVFLFLVSFYWVVQVIKNIVHVTVAGTVGTWWFAPREASSCCSKAVWDSWVRAMTYSFGSICFGSLIVAIVQAAREVAKQMREGNDSLLACCAECILGCIERLVEYFNQWAFVYVGLYGYTFMEAGKNVMTLFRARGWTAIIADMLIDSVLSMVAMCVGILTGVIGIFAAQAAGVDVSNEMAAAPFFLGFLFGFSLSATLFSVVSSAVNTVIVCYAEAPAEFRLNHPRLAEEMRASWRQAWPTEFKY